MKVEDANWFSKWEDDLPSPEDLTPISQSLITPDLAMAFDLNTAAAPTQPPSHPPPSSGGDSGSSAAGSEEPARTLKRPRLVWTPQLHKRFVDAVAHLGIKNAVPKTIMQLMSVDGLTRENVASHLQKYRLYLKRMQGHNGNSGGGGGVGGGGGGEGGGGGVVDTASERLFASGPVPPHFLSPVRGNEHFVPYVGNVGILQHQQMAVMRGQFQRPIGQFGMQNGQFEHSFMARQVQQVNRMGQNQGMMSYVEDLEANGNNAGRKVLTLFPTGDNN